MRPSIFHAAVAFGLIIVIATIASSSIPTMGNPNQVKSITDVADDRLAPAIATQPANRSHSSHPNAWGERPIVDRKPPEPESNSFTVRLRMRIHVLVNQERRERDLPPLTFDDRLATIAGSHSREMAKGGYVAHTNPNGETVFDRYQEAGYTCSVDAGNGSYLTAGENIFMASMSGNAVTASGFANRTVSGWMSSPGHRRNLLNPSWRNEGIGIHTTRRGGDLQVYVTQNFC